MRLRFAAGWLAICPVLLAQPARVTDTKLVNAGQGQEVLRKINGRWWSQDNREVYPPSKDGIFWQLDSKPGVCRFFHHRPFDLARAESLHLWMTKPEVESALGAPNRIFGDDDHAFWYYYAANGTKLQVRFMDDGVLGEATYYAIGEKKSPVQSIARELNGRDIYKLLQERATKRSNEWLAKKTEEQRVDQAARSEALRRGLRPGSSHPNMVVVESVPVPRAVESQPAAPKRPISAESLAAITPGATREDVVSRLGDPAARYAITADDGSRESLTYNLDNGQAAIVRLVDGKVVEVRKQ